MSDRPPGDGTAGGGDDEADQPTARQAAAPTEPVAVSSSPPTSGVPTLPVATVAGLSHSRWSGLLSAPVNRRFRVRRSTLLMVVAFAGFATWAYFYPPATSILGDNSSSPGVTYVPVPTTTTTSTTVPPTTTTTTRPAATGTSANTTTTTGAAGASITTTTTRPPATTTTTTRPVGTTTTTSTTGVGVSGTTTTTG